jgi:hypothetical protein
MSPPTVPLGSGSSAPANKSPTMILVDEQNKRLTVEHWGSADPDVVNWALAQPGTELVPRFEMLLKLGVLATRAVTATATVEDVRREFDRWRTTILRDMDALIGQEGSFTQRLNQQFTNMDDALRAYLGRDGELAKQLDDAVGADSEFLRKLRAFIAPDGELAHMLDAYIGGEGELASRLDQAFGETGELSRRLESVFGEKAGLVYRLLNPMDEEAPLGKLRKSLLDASDLANPKSPVALILRELQEVKAAVGIKQAVKAAEQKGTGKGARFQDRVFEALLPIALRFNDDLEQTGDKPGATGKKGDQVATIAGNNGASPRIVFEDKNGRLTYKGEGSIYREVEEAKENRGACLAVVVVADQHRPAHAPLLEYNEPNRTVTVYVADEDPAGPALEVAYCLARKLALDTTRTEGKRLTAASVHAYIARIHGALERIQSIQGGLSKNIKSLEDTKGKLDELRAEIVAALDEMEAGLRQE